jgi:hypothetical protein
MGAAKRSASFCATHHRSSLCSAKRQGLGRNARSQARALTAKASDTAPLISSGIALHRSNGSTNWLPTYLPHLATWRYVRKRLTEAAYGGDMMDVAAALQIALKLEGIEYRPK